MAYQVLARKWRPKRFDEVIGQTHVTRTLQNAIKQNKLAHAYLFTGTRGVGKTSIARLFAKAIRCEQRSDDLNPCLVCPSCKDIDSGSSMDYTEIDGASNNSVDDVRSLIENVQYLPVRGTHKIYVIDEVHMLSVSAFNALLKTLEEPPAHVIFILATTDPHKLLGTVLSRCQRYDFKNVPADLLVQHLEHIAREENIKFSSPRVPRRLADMGKGSVRDTLSILDQVLGLSGGTEVSEESMARALGLARISALKDLLSALFRGETKQCAQVFLALLDENVDLKKLCDQILDSIYDVINSIDEQENLYRSEVLERGALDGITVAELFWIYETLVKDFHWALGLQSSEKVVLVLLQKVSLRRTILSGDDLKLDRIPQSGGQGENRSLKSEARAHATEASPAPTPALATPTPPAKTWENFLTYLRQTSPATAANLEQGNLLEPLNLAQDRLAVVIAFPEDASVFQEFLEERETYSRLRSHLADYFEVGIERIDFKTKIISQEEKEDKNFKTKIEIDDERKHLEEQERKERIMNDPYVQEAQKLFNAKIDKIILKE